MAMTMTFNDFYKGIPEDDKPLPSEYIETNNKEPKLANLTTTPTSELMSFGGYSWHPLHVASAGR